MPHIHFVSLTLVDPRGHVLMQERDEHAPTHPDVWWFPGGGLDPGEEPVEGAVRELAEETGIVLAPEDLTDLGRFEQTTEGGPLWFHFYVARTSLRDSDVDCQEGRQIVFVDPARWDGLETAPLLATVRPALEGWLGAHRPAPSPDARCFAGVILVDREGRILLQERDEHAPIDPEKWGLAGGHLEPGEDFAPAAGRELEEETGVRLGPGELELWREVIVDHGAAHGTWDRMQVFVAATDLTDAHIDCREGRRIVFVDPRTALGLVLSSAAADIVPAFLGSETYRRLHTRHIPSEETA